MGPVIGATFASHGLPVMALRMNDRPIKDRTYVALMCRRPTRQTITAPSSQMTTIGQSVLPHWMLKRETVAGARNNSALTPKFDGFHKCRPLKCHTYLDAIEIKLASTYGQKNGERTRIPTLIPVIYALAG